MKLTGAEIFVKSLENENVDVVFGYPGGALLPIYDKLYDSKKIKHILTRHEQGAVHAADGYARVSGKVGVCIATSGPGGTNLVTGIANAKMDSIPIVAFTGQVSSGMIGNDAFQEADIVGITRSITKHNYLVRSTDELGRIIKEAFYIAGTGRPGPVLVDIPKDITINKAEYKPLKTISMKTYNPNVKGHIQQIKKAADLINRSEKPILYTGGGIISSGAYNELKTLAVKGNIPITTTLLGLGGFPTNHKLFLGMLGMHGTWTANTAIQNCDLIIAIGARFDDRITGVVEEFAPYAKVVHIDIDPASIGLNVPVEIPVVGDAKIVLKELNKYIKPSPRTNWFNTIRKYQKEHPLIYRRKANTIKPQYVMEIINELTKGKAIITTEVGQNQMWAAQFLDILKPRQFITSGGLGTMGYGFPAAIGAAFAVPQRLVIDVAGDGSIQMNIQELIIAVQHKLNIKIVILNNQFLGMVRQWQELFYNKRYAHTCIEMQPDFVKLAEAYGATGIRIDKKKDVKPVLQKAFKVNGPVVLDIKVDREENVFPMVPAGSSISKMIEKSL